MCAPVPYRAKGEGPLPPPLCSLRAPSLAELGPSSPTLFRGDARPGQAHGGALPDFKSQCAPFLWCQPHRGVLLAKTRSLSKYKNPSQSSQKNAVKRCHTFWCKWIALVNSVTGQSEREAKLGALHNFSSKGELGGKHSLSRAETFM